MAAAAFAAGLPETVAFVVGDRYLVVTDLALVRVPELALAFEFFRLKPCFPEPTVVEGVYLGFVAAAQMFEPMLLQSRTGKMGNKTWYFFE